MADLWSKYNFRPAASCPTSATPQTPQSNDTADPPNTSTKFEPAPTTHTSPEQLAALRAAIAADPALTPFRAHVLSLLTQVPRGRYTTYKALAAAAARTFSPPTTTNTTTPKSKSNRVRKRIATTSPSLTTTPPPAHPRKNAIEGEKKRIPCARAVGSAMANNPFAPAAPCHRVLAADGRIGGFGGDWGESGRFVGEKMRLLREEGVRFDGRGRVVGAVWEGFV